MRRIRTRGGMAALFDALMFLSVMSVVSVTVLVAFSPGRSGDDDTQSYLQKCHSVLLGMTLRSWSSSLSSERLMPVSDAIATILAVDKPLPDRIRTEIDAMLRGLFEPKYQAEWSCTLGGSRLDFGSGLNNATGSNVFVSTLSASSPSGPCSYVLTVRYA
jgi:hypothetical protein